MQQRYALLLKLCHQRDVCFFLKVCSKVFLDRAFKVWTNKSSCRQLLKKVLLHWRLVVKGMGFNNNGYQLYNQILNSAHPLHTKREYN